MAISDKQHQGHDAVITRPPSTTMQWKVYVKHCLEWDKWVLTNLFHGRTVVRIFIIAHTCRKRTSAAMRVVTARTRATVE